MLMAFQEAMRKLASPLSCHVFKRLVMKTK